jgi:hypothetical protein
VTEVTSIKEKSEILDLREKWNNLKEVEDRKGYFLDRFVKLAGIISHICREIPMSRQTLYRWKEEDPGFCERLDDVKEDLNDFVESQLYKLIADGVPSAIIFHTKCKMKDRGYVERIDHNVKGKIFNQMKIEIEFVEPDGDKKD